MKRLFLMLMVVALPLAVMNVSFGQDADSRGGSPLDLPAGGRQNAEEEEEDPSELITFYGNEVEASVVVFCFPAYGFCGIDDPYVAIKAEITSSMSQLSAQAWLGMVGYNVEQPHIWKPSPVRATAGNKAGAIAWMNSLVAVENHCLLNAGVAAMQLSQQAPGDSKVVIIMGARAPFCDGQGSATYSAACLDSINAANYLNTPINTVYVTSPAYSGESAFYIDLAAQNQGTFQEISY